MKIDVRRASAIDAPLIARHNGAMAQEIEQLELDQQRLLAAANAVIEDESKGFYLVAEDEHRVVGQLMITYEWSDWRNGVFWWIQSVYVDPAYRGRGVYTSLHTAIVEQAKTAGDVCGIRLYVEKSNENAQRSYRRLGMSRTAYDMYEVDFVLER